MRVTARRSIALAMLVGLAVALAACGGSKKSSGPTARPQVTVEARDFSFAVPEQLPSGWVDVTLHNTGAQVHQIAFVKLGSPSFAQLMTSTSRNNINNAPPHAVLPGV